MKVLADTSIWVDHLRRADERLAGLLNHGDIVIHPFVIGELLLGGVPKGSDMLDDLNTLPRATVAGNDEVLEFIVKRRLTGLGIGYVDAHLLASTILTAEASIWTRDKRLLAAARSLNLAADIQ
ncbi:type II toxin-antitoxin system VapC family toxin [Bradyrhizobium commune]|uniref:PIN domain-containing protein n=1 Tax=Bradyrhizobium commune TaxID=83627 RepID=A0A7S9D7T4_9BRAD|nr:PIN domain-containing protein [Bradyrhizobium commune]QPF92796.1 PIN domain-containing protein [Bradyrhizobium commune]